VVQAFQPARKPRSYFPEYLTTGTEPTSQEYLAEPLPADATAVAADEAAAIETARALDDDVETEVPAYAAASAPVAPRPRTTVAIGPFRVRPAVLAWGMSIAAHAALAAASLLVISWQALHARGIDGPGWGDGAAETGMIDSPGPAGGGTPLMAAALPDGPAPTSDAPPGVPGLPEADSAEPVVAAPVVAAEPTPEVAPAEEDDDEPVAQAGVSASALRGLESLAIAHTPPPAPAHAPSAAANSPPNGSGGGGANTTASGDPAVGAAAAGNPPGPAGGGAGRTGDGGGTAYSGRPGSPDGVRGRRGGLARPDYPAESRRRGEQGRVLLDIEVLPSGAVGDVRVAADPGYPRLVAAAVAQVRREHFAPFVENGRAVPYRLTIPYDFRLQ
jgi:protein TonB